MSLIAAVARNQVIGRAGRLPWRLPTDMRRFRELTTGHHVIMGRRTYESIGKALPDRVNVVLSRRASELTGCTVVTSIDDAFALGRRKSDLPGCVVVKDLEQALSLARRAGEKEAFVIGGSSVYERALPAAERIYLTRVEADVEGDAFFPELDPAQWEEISREDHRADERHAYPFQFVLLERRGGRRAHAID